MAARFKARLDLLDVVGSLLLLSLVMAEPWFWLTFTGFVLMATVYAVKGVHWLRARRRHAA
ncbi:hypothetical protein ABZS98_11070 [Streptomyces avermitilis]|uniref:hypothetical protein n=1 Tax=Streptomyces avermitilis TaxID=33903 RepID=UPI0033BC314A